MSAGADFPGLQGARLFRQHHRNVVAYGIGDAAGVALEDVMNMPRVFRPTRRWYETDVRRRERIKQELAKSRARGELWALTKQDDL